MFDYRIIIITIILVSIGLIVFNSNLKNNEVIWIFFLSIATIFYLIGGTICDGTKPLQFDRSIPIISLETQNVIEGHFVLGCGSIRENPVYYFYIKNKDGNYELWNSNSVVGRDPSMVHTELKLTDEEDPKIEIYENAFFSKVILVVPTNAIQQNFDGNIK